MDRRQFVKTSSAAAVAVSAMPRTLSQPYVRRSRHRSPRFELVGDPQRYRQLDSDGNNGGQYPPGVADGPVNFVRLPEGGWQGGQLAVFQMHAQGQTYRHFGDDLGSLSPGNWCYGPQGNSDDSRYAGITSVVQDDRGSLTGFVHQENFDDVASIGRVISQDTGYSWSYQGTVIRGVEPLADGFMGAMVPSVVRRADGLYVMLYENRFGNGRHSEVHRAVSNDLSRWRLRGPAFANDGDPHYHSVSPRVLWSTEQGKWVCFYATDKAWRYRTSNNLGRWSSATTIQEWDQRWNNTGGIHTWYQAPLDDRQNSSMIFGESGIMLEHRINRSEPATDRYPQSTPFRAR